MKKAEAEVTAVGVFESPIGPIRMTASGAGIVEILFSPDGMAREKGGGSPLVDLCVSQLAEYFAGERALFDVPLDLRGTPFQLSVWQALRLIPCGETWSYGRVARQIGRDKAVRAVGGANHSNPVSIVVPCHRVIGSDGNLTGYGGGLWRKEWLLEHEKKIKL